MGALTQKKGCAYCGALEALNGGPLAPCQSCNIAEYCGQEHQLFDWKRHKMFCKAAKSKNPAPMQERRNSTQQLDIVYLSSNSYRNSKTSTSSDASTSSSSSNQPSTSSGSLSSLSSNSPKSLPIQMISSTSVENAGSPDISFISAKLMPTHEPRSRIISTGDPDIQIIESVKTCSNRVVRKRPQHAVRHFKDHTLNRPYDIDLKRHLSSLLADPNKCAGVTQYDAMALRMKYIADHVIKSLNEFGWAIVDNFFGSEHCHQTLKEMETLYKHGLFSAGQLVAKRNNVQAQDIRSDEIFWFDTKDERFGGAVSLRLLISTIDSVTAHFKDRIPPYKISSRARPMLAVYPGGATRYVKHVDNPAKDGRCITSIYYCNEGWDVEKDGGALRLYPETSRTPITVNPKGDRLIFFFSDCRNPHEVLPTFRQRFAMTIWYYDRDEKDAAMENRRLLHTHRKDAVASSLAPPQVANKNLSSKQDPVESSEPPAKWKIERPTVPAAASYPGPHSYFLDSFSFLRNNQLCNSNNSASILCSPSHCRSTFSLPTQALLKDVAPLVPNLNFSGSDPPNNLSLIFGSSPSAFTNTRSNVDKTDLSQAILQVENRI